MAKKEIKYLWGLLKAQVISRNLITKKGIYKVLENVVFEIPYKYNSYSSYWKNQIIVIPITAERDKRKPK